MKTEKKLDFLQVYKECIHHGYCLSDTFLGKGSYASVYKGCPTQKKIQSTQKLKSHSKTLSGKDFQVAIKVISIDLAPKKYIRKFLPREISTLNRCYGHQNVIKLFEIFANENRVYLAMEYADMGTLLEKINNKLSKLERCKREPEARKLFSDIINGIHYVHSLEICHRDLKCENLLLSTSMRSCQVKIGDFGFAVKKKSDEQLQLTRCGSFAYTAPEILKHKNYDGKKSDIWSLGVILFAMVNGHLPFKSSDSKKILEAIKHPIPTKHWVSIECKDLIRNMLRIRPLKRLTVCEILNHPWMRSEKFEMSSNSEAAVVDVRKSMNNIKLMPSEVPKEYFASDFDSEQYVYAFLQKKISAEKFFDTPKPEQKDSKHEKVLQVESSSKHARTSNSYKNTYANKNNSYYDNSASGDTKVIVKNTKDISRKLFESQDVLYKSPEMHQASTSQKFKTSRSTALSSPSYNYKERFNSLYQTATSPGGESKYEKWVKRLDAPKRPHISSNNTTPNRPKKDIKKEEYASKNCSQEKWVHKLYKNKNVEQFTLDKKKTHSCSNTAVQIKHQPAAIQKELLARKQKRHSYSKKNYELTQSEKNCVHIEQKLYESGHVLDKNETSIYNKKQASHLIKLPSKTKITAFDSLEEQKETVKNCKNKKNKNDPSKYAYYNAIFSNSKESASKTSPLKRDSLTINKRCNSSKCLSKNNDLTLRPKTSCSTRKEIPTSHNISKHPMSLRSTRSTTVAVSRMVPKKKNEANESKSKRSSISNTSTKTFKHSTSSKSILYHQNEKNESSIKSSSCKKNNTVRKMFKTHV